MTSTKYQVLARRYRPRQFSEVIGQESAVTTLKNALRFDKVAHAYLFCGSRGVGKTTLARLFAKALNCLEKTADMEPCNQCSSCIEIGTGQSLDVIEIDGASNRGIDDIRQINETALYSPSAGRYKIYIIDEVHMLTKEAFNALLKTLEEPPEKAKFFFATTEPHKVLSTIVSRCQRFDLGRIQLSQIIEKLGEIAADLGRVAEPEALHLIAVFSDGSLRDAESLFDQILCFAEGTITADVIRTSLGLIPQDHFFALDQAFSEARAAFAFELVETLFASGRDLAHFYEQLIEHVRNLSSARLLGEKGLTLPSHLTSRYLQSSRLYASSQCLYLLEFLLDQESQLQKSACQRAALEAILLHYIQSKNRLPIEILVRRLSELEEALKSHPTASSISESPKPDPTPILEPLKQAPALLPPVPEKVEMVKLAEPASPRLPPKAESDPKPKPIPMAEPLKPAPALLPPAPEKVEMVKLSEPASPPSLPPKAESDPKLEPSPEPSRPLSLKPTPFNPFKLSKEEAALPAEAAMPVKAVIPAAITPPPIPSPEPPKPHEERNIQPSDQTRYETLMRFATVELEGSLKLT